MGHACLLARGEIPLGWSCTAGRERRRWPKAERGFASTPVTRSGKRQRGRTVFGSIRAARVILCRAVFCVVQEAPALPLLRARFDSSEESILRCPSYSRCTSMQRADSMKTSKTISSKSS